MIPTAAALAVLAVLLAWPVPVILAGARWTRRSPAIALILWQSVALAGGLAMIGSLLLFGLSPYGDDLITALRFMDDSTGSPWHWLALAAALLLAAHLLANLVATFVRAEHQRRRHAHLVSLLSEPMGSGTRLIDSPTPIAYCLPGPLSSVTVLSAGLVKLLDEQQLTAVIEHEKAHVAQRHDVVLIAFRAWFAALPWFPIAYRAQREVGLLVEMLADDRARRTVDDDVLAAAITNVGAGADAAASVWAEPGTPDTLHARVARLAEGPLSTAREALLVGAALALLGVPTAIILVPALLALQN